MIASAIRRNTEASLLLLSLVVAIGGYWLAELAEAAEVPPRIFGYAALFASTYFAGHIAIRKLAPGADPLFLPIALMLNAVGFVLISRLDDAIGSPGLAGAQSRWLAFGMAAFIATLWLVKDARDLARYRYTAAALGVSLLLLPILPLIGREVNGARLWVRLGPINFQPAELGKVALVLFFAAYFSERREVLSVLRRRVGPVGVPDPRHFGPVALAWGVSLLVMVQEKDLGSSLLFFGIFVAMLWVATGRGIYLLAGSGMFLAGAFFAYRIFGHVRSRILVWMDPFEFIDGRGYQIVQSLFALATGGVWGTGLGLGRPDLVPSVHTDFIFSALGEELGLAGTAAMLAAYAIFSARAFGLATRCRDDFSKLLVFGLGFAFTLQTLIILGGVIQLIPLTGVTLPFMSYGGSSLLSNFIIVALLTRISHDVTRLEGEAPPTELTLPAGGAR